METLEKLKNSIRDVYDFPKKGIVFKDITPVLLDSGLCTFVIKELSDRIRSNKIDVIAGIESRGFLFGMSLAQELKCSFLPIRKKGKLPFETHSHSYQLEYGQAEIEMHTDVVTPGMQVHVHDDLLATGGTAAAAARLIEKQGGIVSSYSFLIELKDLEGRKKLSEFTNNIDSLIVY